MSYKSQYQAAVHGLQSDLIEANKTIRLLQQKVDDLSRAINPREEYKREFKRVIADLKDYGQPLDGDCGGWLPPLCIREMAKGISAWFDSHGINDWSLHGIADRRLVDKLKSKINFLETQARLHECINRLREADLRASYK